MAHGSAVTIIYDQSYNGGRVMALITNVGATDLTATTGLIDASELANHDSSPLLSIEKISWNTGGVTAGRYFSVIFTGSSDSTAVSLSGNGHWGKSHTAGLDAAIPNNAGTPTGDVAITTTNCDNAADTVNVVIILKKVSGFATRPDYSG